MDATLIVIDSEAELARANALVEKLMTSDRPSDTARLQAQARLIAAYEETKWPRRAPSTLTSFAISWTNTDCRAAT
jgi:HTH-type transcriptional regulator/antitoxin HigA